MGPSYPFIYPPARPFFGLPRLDAAGSSGVGARNHMSRPTPVSRELVRIIRDNSGLGREGASLCEHVRGIEERQAQAIEFYLRSCNLRLGTLRTGHATVPSKKTGLEPPGASDGAGIA
jgi:hypothetical protein